MNARVTNVAIVTLVTRVNVGSGVIRGIGINTITIFTMFNNASIFTRITIVAMVTKYIK